MKGYTYMENVKLCTFNDKGFIYRLIEMDEDVVIEKRKKRTHL